MTTHVTDDNGSLRAGARLLRRRNKGDGAVLAGVAGGIADYLGVDVTLVRVLIVSVAVLGGGAGLALYLVGWLLIPGAGSDTSVVERMLHS